MKITKYLILLLITVASLTANIPVSEVPTALNLANEDDKELIISFSVGELEYFIVETAQGQFVKLSIPGYHSNMNVGAPAVPVMNQIVRIPVTADISVELISAQYEEISLAKHGISAELMPVQPSLSKSVSAAEVPFAKNVSEYTADSYYSPYDVTIQDLGVMRYTRLARVSIAPVSYNPIQRSLRVMKSGEVRIRFANVDKSADEELYARYYSPYFAPIIGQTINSVKSGEGPVPLLKFPVKYVIISPENLLATLQPFIDWKIQQGFEVIVETNNNIGNNTAVKNYLSGLYNNAAPDDPAPTFVLLVGDNENMPAFSGVEDSHITDIPFVTVTNDMLPDMHIGRFPAQSAALLQPQIDKTLYYEKYEIADPSYLNNVTLIAGYDSYYTSTHGVPTLKYGEANYFNRDHGFTTVNEYIGNVSPAPILQTISNGVGFVNYTAHGSHTSWSDPYVSIANVNSLTNAGKYSLAIGNACLTASFQVAQCFGEAWMQAINKGAFGYIGGTNSTYWDEDVWWSTGYFGHVGDGVTPTYSETTMGAYDAGFTTTKLTTLSALTYVGNYAVTTSGSDLDAYYWEIYELFGDPSLMVYWTEPEEFSVSYEEFIPVGSHQFTVSVGVPMAMVAIAYQGQTLGSIFSDENGYATITFENPLSNIGSHDITVTGQNHQPYFNTVNVVIPAVVTMNPDTVQISTPTDISVNILDSVSAPISDVMVWAYGPGFFSDTVLTGETGTASLNVNVLYGPYIFVKAQREGDLFYLYSDTLWVAGADTLENPTIIVQTSYGLSDTLGMNLPAIIYGSAENSDVRVYAGNDSEHLVTVNADSLEMTATSYDEIQVFLLKEGYNCYRTCLPVIEARGTVSGEVSSQTGSPLEEVIISGIQYDKESFSVLTVADGTFLVPSKISCGWADIEVKKFGYDIIDTTLFIRYDHNQLEFQLTESDSSVLSGRVTTADFLPLAASMSVYRNDTGELIKDMTADSADGSFSVTLRNYEYLVKVRSKGYEFGDTLLNVTADTELNVALEKLTTILIVDADTKMKYADRACTIPLGEVKSEKISANDLGELFSDMGNEVEYISLSETHPEDWANYLALVFAKGSDRTKVTTDFVSGLANYVSEGGLLLIEGGEIGWNHQYDDLGRKVLHISGFSGDNGGNLIPKNSTNELMNQPNILPVMSHTYSGWGDEDVLTPADTSEMAAVWSSNMEKAAAIAYNHQVVFLAYNFANLIETDHKYAVAGNIASYLGLNYKEINLPPQAFSLLSPVDEFVWTDTMQYEFKWEKSIDSDELFYVLHILSSTFQWRLESDTNCFVVDLNSVPLPRSEVLTWSVTADDGFNVTESSEANSFSISSKVGIKTVTDLPDVFTLNQNYPNPFNPVTTIRYGLPEFSSGHLIIYNMVGAIVREFEFTNQATGWYDLVWNGTNQQGTQISTGVYFLTVESQSVNGNYNRKTIKMIFIK